MLNSDGKVLYTGNGEVLGMQTLLRELRLDLRDVSQGAPVNRRWKVDTVVKAGESAGFERCMFVVSFRMR
jgi:hypothetical protein